MLDAEVKGLGLMKTKEMSHPLASAAFFILSRALLYAALWFSLWTAVDYLRKPASFRLEVSREQILLSLFMGWLFAVIKWEAKRFKRKPSE